MFWYTRTCFLIFSLIVARSSPSHSLGCMHGLALYLDSLSLSLPPLANGPNKYGGAQLSLADVGRKNGEEEPPFGTGHCMKLPKLRKLVARGTG